MKQYPSQLLKSWYIFVFQLPFLAELRLKMFDFKYMKDIFTDPTGGIRNEERRLSLEEINIYKHYCGRNISYPVNYYRASTYVPCKH